jgi:hypothetical protein
MPRLMRRSGASPRSAIRSAWAIRPAEPPRLRARAQGLKAIALIDILA